MSLRGATLSAPAWAWPPATSSSTSRSGASSLPATPVPYLQTVRVLGVKTTNRSSVTVRVGSETRTFKDGEGVTFAAELRRAADADRRSGRIRRVRARRAGRQPRGFRRHGRHGCRGHLPGRQGSEDRSIRRLDTGASWPAAAGTPPNSCARRRAIGPAVRPATGAIRDGRAAIVRPATPPDFTTVQRLDQPIAPAVTAGDAFFDFLFSKAPSRYRELKRRAARPGAAAVVLA